MAAAMAYPPSPLTPGAGGAPGGNAGETEVYSWGQGGLGQLGHSDDTTYKAPRVLVATMGLRVKAVVAGNQHSAILTADGDVYTFGRGNFGQLGHGIQTSGSQQTPTLVEGLPSKAVVQIACGWHHMAALTKTQEVWTWGSGEYGRLGHGDESRQVAPKMVEALHSKPVIAVACGGFHTCAITEAGTLYTWGGGYFGQLGHGDENDRKTPTVVSRFRDVAVHQVSCGTHHTLALSDNGDVWSWGSGEYGKLGHGDETKHTSPKLVEPLRGKGIVYVACGGFHSGAVTDTGGIFMWGGGDKGQLGLGEESNVALPTLVDGLRGRHIVSLSLGMHHSMGVSDRGEVFSWGSGEYGRLGHGDDQNSPSALPISSLGGGKNVVAAAAGGFHSLALVSASMNAAEAAAAAVSAAQVFGGEMGGRGMSPFDATSSPMKPRTQAGKSALAFEAGEESMYGLGTAGGRMAGRGGASADILRVDTGGGGGMAEDDEEDYKMQHRLRTVAQETAEMKRQVEIIEERHKLELTRLETRLQAAHEERNHLKKQLEKMSEKAKLDSNLKMQVQKATEELGEMKKKHERLRNDLKQRTVDVHMLQVRVSQLCGSELDGLTVSQLEELERMQSEALRRVSAAKYQRLRQEMGEREEARKEEIDKLRRDFEGRMEKQRDDLAKLQEEKMALMGLEQRLRQEFQTQVQAEQMSNEELRVRLETLQDGFVQLRSILRKDKQNRMESGDD
mmetsp:Transcript_30680/g.80173  ORF Transcript_30680/g.80173 Transcript_30680/m.80173 type:complete len:731 (-) Transcript_30680:486-2678(-)